MSRYKKVAVATCTALAAATATVVGGYDSSS